MRFKNNPEADTTGTRFHGSTIKTTVATLISEVGKPVYSENDGLGKYNYMWVCELNNGDVFTIYDWKEGRPLKLNEEIEFNIGAKNPMSSIEADYALGYM